jgi:hypothetical protein
MDERSITEGVYDHYHANQTAGDPGLHAEPAGCIEQNFNVDSA